MAQYGPSQQTAEVITGNMRTTVETFPGPGLPLGYGPRAPLGISYYDSTKTLQNPDGTWGKYRRVKYQSTTNSPPLTGPGVVYWTDENGTTVTSDYSESVTQGLNSIAGVMMANTTDMPSLTPETLNGNVVWICVGGVVTGAVAPAGLAAGDALIGSATAWTPDRVASGTAPTNKVLGYALTAVQNGLADISVELES